MKLSWPIKGIGTAPGIYISQKFANVFILSQPYTYEGVTYPAGTNFYKALFGMEGHNGVDISCVIGTPVYAPHDGTVEALYSQGGYGNYIRLRFMDGDIENQVILGHLSEILKTGLVKEGELIAKSGNTGTSTNPHCHFGLGQVKNGQILNYNNGYKGSIDPTPYMKGQQMQLIDDNKTLFLVGSKGKLGFADPNAASLFQQIEDTSTGDTSATPLVGIFESGVILHKK